MNSPAPNLEQVDSLLKLVDREIWLVTAASGGRRSGLTATWVSQVSLDRERPVLLAGLSPRNFTTELVQASGFFAAHLVTHEQVNLAYRLAASSGRDGDKLAGEPLVPNDLGVPVLANARVGFVCHVWRKLDAGDRVFFWGDVIAAGYSGAASPTGNLLKEHAFIETLSLAERKHLKGLREADAQALRPVAEAWRSAATGRNG
jgi:flavin reductase (DIM6/NTAB) family NADH-FMN oxidoreductase RutF